MQLPIGISVEQYKRQAKELLKDARLGDADAEARIREHHPDAKRADAAGDAEARGRAARDRARERIPELGAIRRVSALSKRAWRRSMRATSSGWWRFSTRIPRCRATSAGSGSGTRADISPAPRCFGTSRGIRFGRRCRRTSSRLRVCSSIGAVTKKEAEATIGLLLTSKQASEAGVALALIDLLVRAGARFDVESADVLSAPLLNLAPETARALVDRGAPMELRHAAALGEHDGAVAECSATRVAQSALDDALIFASIRDQREAAAMLLERGARGDVLLAPGGQSPRTALHEAANRGFAELVEMLFESGASAAVLDARWGGTAAGWAEAGGFPELASRLRAWER